jgi:nicotinic acid mononucleotide adenylyltransferase
MSTAVMCFGRFQPVTRAHVAMFDLMYKFPGYKYIYTSGTFDNKNNVLTFEEKTKWIHRACSRFGVSLAKDPLAALVDLSNGSFDKVTLLCGSDRYQKYQTFHKYINHPDETKRIPLKELQLVDIGSRYSQSSNGIEGVSATKAREAARNGDIIEFGKMVPENFTFEEVLELYNLVRRGQGIENDRNETT